MKLCSLSLAHSAFSNMSKLSVGGQLTVQQVCAQSETIWLNPSPSERRDQVVCSSYFHTNVASIPSVSSVPMSPAYPSTNMKLIFVSLACLTPAFEPSRSQRSRPSVRIVEGAYLGETVSSQAICLATVMTSIVRLLVVKTKALLYSLTIQPPTRITNPTTDLSTSISTSSSEKFS